MQSADSDHFFQTDASQAQKERRAAKAGNKHGNPLRMKSKILAAIPDPASPGASVLIAESAGCVRSVHLDVRARPLPREPPSSSPKLQNATNSAPSPRPRTEAPRPPSPASPWGAAGTGPSLSARGTAIWSWDTESAQPRRTYTGHSNFVKTVACARLADREVLLSGGADKKIMVWDIETGRRMHTVQDLTASMLTVQHLAIDPVLSTHDVLVLASASSDPGIRRWEISLNGYVQLPRSPGDGPEAERLAIQEHDTSVYKLVFDADLWAASAYCTAKCLARSRGFVADVFTHGDYVRAVLLSAHWVVTAGRDENVKVWDRATGKLYCTLKGHYEEVTDFVMLRNIQGSTETVCSVSIDGTIRTWSLDKAALDTVVSAMQACESGHAETAAADSENLLAAEEEAELAGLMEG